MVVLEKLNVEISEQEKNQPIHQWVYQVLRSNIIKLHLRPAQRISENEVSEALGVSRTPVREAFIRLAEDGLIKVTPQKRSIVSLIDLDQADEARFIRIALEKAVIKEASGRLSDADRAALRSNIETQRVCQREKAYEQMLAVDNDFHRIIFRACGKERSWHYIKKLDYNYDRLRAMVLPLSLDKVILEHGRIEEIIESGTVGGVDEIVDCHLTQALINRVVCDYPSEYFAQDPKSRFEKLNVERRRKEQVREFSPDGQLP
jgi:GntR family transcriptional regulator, rspAB operon transcriptional repressor